MYAEVIPVSKLEPHPKNGWYFDPISGVQREEFFESIRKQGVVEPIVITPEHIIVSGHQRVEACVELGIEEIPYVLMRFENEDAVELALIETNIRQRGVISQSSVKMGRIAKRLEELYGCGRGVCAEYSKSDIAGMLGVNPRTLQRHQQLLELIPELQEMVDGDLSTTVAVKIFSRLSREEQEELFSKLPVGVQITEKIAKDAVAEIQKEKDGLQSVVTRYVQESAETARKLEKVVVENGVLRDALDESDKGDLIRQLDELKVRERQLYEKLQAAQGIKDIAAEGRNGLLSLQVSAASTNAMRLRNEVKNAKARGGLTEKDRILFMSKMAQIRQNLDALEREVLTIEVADEAC